MIQFAAVIAIIAVAVAWPALTDELCLGLYHDAEGRVYFLNECSECVDAYYHAEHGPRASKDDEVYPCKTGGELGKNNYQRYLMPGEIRLCDAEKAAGAMA